MDAESIWLAPWLTLLAGVLVGLETESILYGLAVVLLMGALRGIILEAVERLRV